MRALVSPTSLLINADFVSDGREASIPQPALPIVRLTGMDILCPLALLCSVILDHQASYFIYLASWTRSSSTEFWVNTVIVPFSLAIFKLWLLLLFCFIAILTIVSAYVLAQALPLNYLQTFDFCWDRASICKFHWLQIQNSPASASWQLELHVHVIMSSQNYHP